VLTFNDTYNTTYLFSFNKDDIGLNFAENTENFCNTAIFNISLQSKMGL